MVSDQFATLNYHEKAGSTVATGAKSLDIMSIPCIGGLVI